MPKRKKKTNTPKVTPTPASKKKKKEKIVLIKLEPKPLTEKQIQEFVSFFNKHKRFPSSKIPCTISGKLSTCTGDWMEKKIKQYGGPENLLRKYISRGAIKAQKELQKPISKRKKSRKILKELKSEDGKTWDLPKIEFTGSKPLTPAEITDATRTSCFRPDIYLNNDGHCQGCKYFDVCSCKHKTAPKVSSKKEHNSVKKLKK